MDQQAKVIAISFVAGLLTAAVGFLLKIFLSPKNQAPRWGDIFRNAMPYASLQALFEKVLRDHHPITLTPTAEEKAASNPIEHLLNLIEEREIERLEAIEALVKDSHEKIMTEVRRASNLERETMFEIEARSRDVYVRLEGQSELLTKIMTEYARDVGKLDVRMSEMMQVTSAHVTAVRVLGEKYSATQRIIPRPPSFEITQNSKKDGVD